MAVVTIRDDGKVLNVTFPYDADAVSRLKDAVPSHDRSFDPATKAWKVNRERLPEVIESMVAGGHTITDASAPVPKISEFFGVSDSAKVEAKARAAAIVEQTPVPLRHRVLREYARLLYPDLYSGRR